MSSSQQKRESLLSMIGGGSGHTEDYIEIVHYITPEGAPNGVGYRAHSFSKEHKTGKPYETILEYSSLEHLEELRALSMKWTKREYSPLPVRDSNSIQVGAPKDAGITYIGL